MTVRVMIVEDEAPARRTLRDLLGDDPDVELVGESWGPRAVQEIEELEPDLVLLDVRMPGMNGFEVLGALEDERIPDVIFVTAFGEHAVDAFEVRAIDYLLKPFTDTRFREALARAKDRLAGDGGADVRARLGGMAARSGEAGGRLDVSGSRRIVFRDGSTTVVLPRERIEWIEASGPYVVVHAEGREYLVRASLTSVEERLAELGFVRVHRSAVVNLGHVREVQPLSHGDALINLRGGAKVKLSRSRRADFEAALDEA